MKNLIQYLDKYDRTVLCRQKNFEYLMMFISNFDRLPPVKGKVLKRALWRLIDMDRNLTEGGYPRWNG